MGRLLLEGRLLTVGRLVLTRPALADCGRLMLPPTLALLVRLLRPLLGKARLIEPPVLLPCLTLAT